MKSRGWLIVLTVMVIASLALNTLLLAALLRARSSALDVLASARNGLAQLSNQPFTTEVEVDQAIPFNTTVPIEEEIVVPLDIQYPLSTVVNTAVNIPVLGRQEIAIPIETVIPISYTLSVPIRMDVPISMTYRLQTQIPVSIEIPPEVRAPLDQVLEQVERSLTFGP